MNRIALLIVPASLLTAAWLAGCSNTSSGPASQSAPTTPASSAAASAATTPASSTPAAAATLATKTTSLGEIIVDGKGMTAYVFDKDVTGAGTSTCTADCAKMWPAIVANSDPPTVEGITAPVGVITDATGAKQITSAGHVLTPAGQKVGWLSHRASNRYRQG